MHQTRAVAHMRWGLDRLMWPSACAGLFLLVFGAKAVVASAYGSAVPYWDQWDAEAANLYRPWLAGEFSLTQLFASHNEHRIAITRLFILLLFELTGGWDPLVQMFANAALYAGFVVILASLLVRCVAAEDRFLVLAFCAVVFALPLAWENVIVGGLQSQFTFVMIFGAIAIHALTGHRAFAPVWWLGLCAAGAAYVSMASGALGVFAALAINLAQYVWSQRAGRRELIALGVLTLAGVAMLFGVTAVPEHAAFRAIGLGHFLGAIVALAAWPLATIFGALVVQLPLMMLILRTWRNPPPLGDPVWPMLGLAAFVVAQILSLAYGRAAMINSARYIDMIVILLPLNCAALLICGRDFVSLRVRRVVPFFTAVWLFLIITALFAQCSRVTLPSLAGRAAEARLQEDNVVAFLKSGDSAALRDKPKLAIPYPDPERLAALLSDPAIRAFLPEPVRPAEADVNAMRGRTLLKGKLSAMMGRARVFVQRHSWFIAGFGLALLLACAQLRIMTRRLPDSPVDIARSGP